MLLVVIPFTSKEVPIVLKNLALVAKLDRMVSNPCLLTYEHGTEGVGDVTHAAMEVFGDVKEFTYDRIHTGWPAGPNHAFKSTAWHIGESKRNLPWLWWEADAVPIKTGWLDTLDAAYVAGGKPFAGHVVGGMEHMNGVGIYPPDVRQYSTRAMTAIKTPWDVAMKAETRHLTTMLNHLILHFWNIKDGVNHNGPEGVPLSVKTRKELKKWTTKEAVLLHHCKDGSIQDVLLK